MDGKLDCRGPHTPPVLVVSTRLIYVLQHMLLFRVWSLRSLFSFIFFRRTTNGILRFSSPWCTPGTPPPTHAHTHTHHQERTLVDELVAYNCDPNTEYNEVASLFLSDADTAIRQVWKAFRIGMVIRGMAIQAGVPSDWSCSRRPCCCSSCTTGRATDIPRNGVGTRRTYVCGRNLPSLKATFTARITLSRPSFPKSSLYWTAPITTRCVLL